MKNIRNNKTFVFAISIITILVALTACKNLFNTELIQKVENNTYLVISSGDVSLNARTINPTQKYVNDNFKNIYLYAKKTKDTEGNTVNGTQRTLINSASSLAEVYNKQLLLEDGAGEYTLEMKGVLDEIYFYKKLEEVQLQANKTNSLTFALEPAKSSNALGTPFGEYGGLSVTINTKIQGVSSIDNVDSIYVTLKHLGTATIIDQRFLNWQSTPKLATKTVYEHLAKNNETAYNGKIPAGSYRLTLDFFTYDTSIQKDITINTFSYIVNVIEGRNTYFEETFDLNKILKIQFDSNTTKDAVPAPGYRMQTRYILNKYDELPVMSKEGCNFKGWYKSGGSNGPYIWNVDENTANNTVFYAKFEPKAMYVDSSNGNDDDDEHDGTSEAAAVRTVAKAIEKIHAASNNFKDDWYIFMKGEFEPQTITNTLGEDSIHAKSIIIVGKNNACIKSTESSPALTIQTKIPVVLKDIQITGDSNGGSTGIFIYDQDVGGDDIEPELTIGNGVNIAGNAVHGIQVTKGKINLYGSVVVDDIYFDESVTKFILLDNLTEGASVTLTPNDYYYPYYYDSEGGYVVEKQIVFAKESNGVKVSDNTQYIHVTPETEGHDIWYIDDNGNINKHCTVVFNSPQTNKTFTKILGYGDEIGEPNETFDPPENCVLTGWFKSNDDGTTLTDRVNPSDIILEENLSLYANWAQPFSDLYVDTGDNGSDENEGTEEHPLKTIGVAVNKIKSWNIADDYTIHVTGLSSESITLDENITANSITFIGDENHDYGISSSSSSTIDTSAPVVFENFVIQYTGHDNGSRDALALTIGEEANVSLTQKTKIYAESGVSGRGKGGVYLEGTLTMEDNSEIYGLSPTKSGQNYNGGGGIWIQGGNLIMNDNSSIHSCYADNMGGAIYLQYGEVTMNDSSSIGGQEKGCSAYNNGGAVYMEDGEFTMNGSSSISYCSQGINSKGVVHINKGNFTMNGGSIHHNTGGVEVSATAKETYVYSGTFIMKSGSISNNTGIGVCVDAACKKFSGSNGSTKTQKASAVFDMQGGTISGNTENGVKVAVAVSDSPYKANSGTFKMSGDALVDSTNDVLLCYQKRENEIIGDVAVAQGQITVSGTLTGDIEHPIKAKITPQNYEAGLEVLNADGADLSIEYDFFAVTPQVTGEVGNQTTTNWYITSEGKLTSTNPNGGDSMPIGYSIPSGSIAYTQSIGTREDGKGPEDDFDIPNLLVCNYLVTQSEYEKYMTYYGAENGGDVPSGDKASTPAYYVSWVEAIVYCNLLSKANTLTPVYSMDGSTNVDDWGSYGITKNASGKYYFNKDEGMSAWDLESGTLDTDFSASGFRLLTSAEYNYIFSGETPKLTNTSYNEWCHNHFMDDYKVYYNKTTSALDHNYNYSREENLGFRVVRNAE